MKEYDIVLLDERFLKEGEEMAIQIRDCETFESLAVRAVLSRSLEKLPGADKLWAKTSFGIPRGSEPWYIKILEELDEDAMGDLIHQNPSPELEDKIQPSEGFKKIPLGKRKE